MLLLNLFFGTFAAHAQNADWVGTTSSDWNTATNWAPPTAVPTGIATFGPSLPNMISISGGATIEALQFNAPNYTFDIPVGTLTITGSGINAPGGRPTFDVIGGSTPVMDFRNMSTAGTAIILAGNPISLNNGFDGGFIMFHDFSTAGQATITARDASNIEFHDSSTAGNAMLTAAFGGFIFFNETSSADHATIAVESGGQLVFSLFDGGEFQGGTSTAGDATITSSGLIEFHEGSKAGNATINTHFGVTNFFDTSTADNAAFTVIEGNMNFFNNSSGGTATIIAGRPVSQNGGFDAGFIKFMDNSTADHATISSLDGSSVEFHDSSRADHATLIVGTGGFLEFVDTSSGDQATVINDAGGEVKIADLTTGGTSFGSIAGAGTFNLGSKQLTVGSNNTSTMVSGVIEDHFPGPGQVGGSLVKVGTGTLALVGANTYSGKTTIQAGTLAVGTLIAADQPISTALGTGNVFVTGGTLRTTSLLPVINPLTGTPIVPGALQVNIGGNYTQMGANATLLLGIGGTQAEQFDHVVVSGNATLDAILEVRSLDNFHPSNGDAFQVLTTGGTVHGNFGTLDESTFNTTPGVVPGDLQLRPVEIVTKNAVVLAYIKPPPGQEIPENGSGDEHPIIEDDSGVTLPPANPDEPLPVREVLQLLDPTVEQLTSLYEIGFSGANMQRFSLNDRMFQIQQGMTGFVSNIAPMPEPSKSGLNEGKGEEGKKELPPAYQPSPENRWGIWISGSGNWVDVNSTTDALGYRFTNASVSAGVDYLIIPGHLAIGAFGAYQHTRADLSPTGSVEASTGRGGVYGTFFDRGWYVNAAVWGGGTNYSTAREGILGTPSGDTSGSEVSTFAETGYLCNLGGFSFGPLISLQYTHVSFDGFNEHGSLVPLDINGTGQSSLRYDVGGQLYFKVPIGKTLLVPTLKVAYEHECEYSTLSVSATVPGLNNATATFFGPSIGRNSVIINAGASLQITPRIWLTISYDGQQGRSHYNANGVDGVISFSF